MAKVYIARSAWKIILEEIRHFASMGNREAIVYPLFGFIRAEDCLKAPWEMLELADIESFVVAYAHPPLRKYCDHTPVRAQFVFKNEAEKEEWQNDIDEWSERLCGVYPTLEVGNLHSHPFSRFKTYPSMGAYGDYARIKILWEQLRKRKADTALEIILCRSIFGWKACCFAFDAKQQIVTLGKAEIVPDAHPQLEKLLAIPYWKRKNGRKWEEKQKEKTFGRLTFGRFYFGWTSVCVDQQNGRRIFIHLPPQFPETKDVLVQICDTASNAGLRTEKHPVGYRGFQLSLNDIIQKCEE